jgi:hypothetical protein
MMITVSEADAVRRRIELLIWNIGDVSLLMLGYRDERHSQEQGDDYRDSFHGFSFRFLLQ